MYKSLVSFQSKILFALIILLSFSCTKEESKKSSSNTLKNESQLTTTSQNTPPPTDKPNFRGIPFGVQKEKVRDWESGDPIIDEGYLAYEGKVASLSSIRVYYFTSVSNKFGGSAYLFKEEHSNENLYIKDYQSVQNILEEKYGEPTSGRGMTWLDDLYQDDPSEYGFAVSLGDLVYNNVWQKDSLEIAHTLKGDNYEISHSVVYRYIPLQKVFEDESRKSSTDNF